MTTAAEKRSERASSGSPRVCSGDMYGHLPITRLSLLAAPTSGAPSAAARAIPKSAIFTSPSRDSRMFEGEMSLCTTRRACATSSPLHISIATCMAAPTGTPSPSAAAALRKRPRSGPSTYSIAM